MTLLLGTNFYPATGATEARQQNAVRAAAALPGVVRINLQFADRVDLREAAGFVNLPVLIKDSLQVSGRPGIRKPIVSEMFERLSVEASHRGCDYFGFFNSDIVLSERVIDLVRTQRRDAHIFSRMDFDGASGADRGVLIFGADLFVIAVAWWRKNAGRFRPYVVGESCWDNVYTSLLMSYADAELYNRETWIRHEQHATAWQQSPFAEYNHYLATLDAPYFSRWAKYIYGLEEMRARQGSAEEERQWQKDAFAGGLAWKDRLIHAGRCLRANLRHRWRSRFFSKPSREPMPLELSSGQ